MIEVKQFSKKFQNNLTVFDNISFDIYRGEFVSIVGPSGSGKSTLLRCIIGLDDVFSGTIRIDGKDSREYLKLKRIAFVLQKYSSFKWLSVYDNVATALNKLTISKNEQKDKIMHILEKVGLIGFENYYINQLSGGMRQRVAVARALVQDTDIIAMDEPFGALDMKIRENLQLLIKDIKKTVLFVTHDIEEAIFLSDKIILLSKIPVKFLRIYNNSRLVFRNELNTDIKYQKNFSDLRKEVEDSLSDDEEQTNFILRKLYE